MLFDNPFQRLQNDAAFMQEDAAGRSPRLQSTLQKLPFSTAELPIHVESNTDAATIAGVLAIVMPPCCLAGTIAMPPCPPPASSSEPRGRSYKRLPSSVEVLRWDDDATNVSGIDLGDP